MLQLVLLLVPAPARGAEISDAAAVLRGSSWGSLDLDEKVESMPRSPVPKVVPRADIAEGPPTPGVEPGQDKDDNAHNGNWEELQTMPAVIPRDAVADFPRVPSVGSVSIELTQRKSETHRRIVRTRPLLRFSPRA